MLPFYFILPFLNGFVRSSAITGEITVVGGVWYQGGGELVVIKKQLPHIRMKNPNILVQPSGKALSLLRSQFAKKPKGPV